jgi:hypothetical protein
MAQLIIAALLQYGPEAAILIKQILEVDDPTQAQWDALFLVATQKKYDDYIAAALAKAGK